jgi:hypothetical protein
MKKLLLLLILSFFSAQGLASSCPDGSEPTRYVSADGSYYKYTCGDVPVFETVATNSGLEPNTLKQIKVVKDWEPIANYEALKDYISKTEINGHKLRHNEKHGCIDRITYAKQISPQWMHNNSMIWAHCASYIHQIGTKNPQIVGDILLSWASADNDPMVWNRSYNDFNGAGYQIPSTIGTFSQFYALWYDKIVFTSEQRKLVDDYMTMKLMTNKFPVLNPGTRKCNINNINSIYHKKTGTNNCGNIRDKVAVGEIMLGFRLEDQKLLDKGHDDIYVVYAFINKDGINLNHASRGGNTVNYSWEYTYYMSILAEIYSRVGYDFYEHTLPHGAKVHEYLAFNYRLLYDFKLTAQWAKHDVGSMWLPYSKINNLSQEAYEKTDGALNVIGWEDRDKYFVKAHKTFVSIYMPHIDTDVTYFDLSYNHSHGLSSNMGVTPYMLYIGNNFTLEKIQAKKAAELTKLEAELSIFGIEDETFNLKLDKVDFIEIEPFILEREKEYLHPYQLHKAVIHGDLKTKNGSNKKFDFFTLVFKQADIQEQRLVIHIGDRAVKPFKRHSDSLQKKCGSKLMNQWDWLSFISETNDINNARNQQCHYDYFKEANDEEAWELLQAVLSGTDSILDYLQTNVER